MIEGNGELLDNETIAGGNMLHDQDSAVIMMATRHVKYTPFQCASLGEKSHVNREEGAAQEHQRKRHPYRMLASSARRTGCC